MAIKHIIRAFGFLVMLASLCPMIPAHQAEAATVYVAGRGGYQIGSSQRFGIGLQSGAVSGLSFKYFMTRASALQVGLGGSP